MRRTDSRPEMRSVLGLLGLAAFFAFTGCKPKDSFRVQVVTPDSNPVAGARLSVGFDWPTYCDTTDDSGFIYVPNWANGEPAHISKNNFYSLGADVSPDAQVTLTPTPESLRFIGVIDGYVVRFGPETLITVTDAGRYHVYAYTDTRVTEVASAQLPGQVLSRFVRGDTLWYSTYSRGVYAYLLADPLDPVSLMHLDIPGSLGPLAVFDTFVVAANWNDWKPLRVFKYRPEGSVKLVSSFDSLVVQGIDIVSHYVVAVGWAHPRPTIYDIADVRHPREVYQGAHGQYWDGFIHENRAFLNGADTVSGQWVSGYAVLDLADPAHPVQTGPFPTDSRLCDVLNDSMAVGDRGGMTILRGSITGGFHSVALVNTDSNYQGYSYQGSFPPYYALNGSLWKLVRPMTEQGASNGISALE